MSLHRHLPYGMGTAVAYLLLHGEIDPAALAAGGQLRRDLMGILAENLCAPVRIQALHVLEETDQVFLTIDYPLYEKSEIDGRDPEAVEDLIKKVMESSLGLFVEFHRLHLLIDLYEFA